MDRRAATDTAPNAARAYAALLDQGVALQPDRDLVKRLEALYPEGVPGPRQMAAANRVFLELAVRDAVRAGIGQVLDLGAGYPLSRPLHEVAREVNGQARCAYVDLDPAVVSSGVAAVRDIPGVAYAHTDLTRPGEVMADPDVRSVIDPGCPVAAVFGLVLHFLAATDARRVVAGWADWLPPGSRFVITAGHWADPVMWQRVREVYGPTLHNHSGMQVAGMLRGLDVLGSGVMAARGWGPEALEPHGPGRVLAVVARKP